METKWNKYILKIFSRKHVGLMTIFWFFGVPSAACQNVFEIRALIMFLGCSSFFDHTWNMQNFSKEWNVRRFSDFGFLSTASQHLWMFFVISLDFPFFDLIKNENVKTFSNEPKRHRCLQMFLCCFRFFPNFLEICFNLSFSCFSDCFGSFFSDFSNPFFESEQNNLNCYISRIEPYGWGWFLLEAGARFLVVVPVTLLEQWRRELDTWARGWKMLKVLKSQIILTRNLFQRVSTCFKKKNH